MNRTLASLLLLFFFLSPALADPDIEALIDKMTLEEKLGQLQMLGGSWEGTLSPEHQELVRKGLLGSTLNIRDADRVNALQRIAVEESRLGIPLIFAFDVIHGYRTIFPIPLGETATFDPEDARRSAEIAAREATAVGLKWTFAPMVDIARDARWGRISEGAGEDPFLGSAMARARVQGFQGDDYSQPDRVVACAKHWVAYGAAEAGRDYNTTDVTERSLREVYFPPFKAAVDQGVGTFMSAFNDLDGVPTSGNRWTLTDILRTEWGFDGVVVSDFESVKEMINHRAAADGKEAARMGLGAGVDIEMVSRLYNQELPALIKSGEFPMEVVDESVRRILRLKKRLGLFKNPYCREGLAESTLLHADHRAEARKIAARSLVLLKNEKSLLPLTPETPTIAVLGPLADDPQSILGSWAGDGYPSDAVTVLQGVKEAVGDPGRVLYSKGVAIDVVGANGNFNEKAVNSAAGGTNVSLVQGVANERLASTPVPAGEFDRAVGLAKQADLTILVVGETAAQSGEAASRTELNLPGRQLELIQAVHKTGKPYVVVLMNGRPMALPWLAENSPALLETWFAGTEGGHAIADVLFGKVNPGGKLPVSFPRNVGQEPLYYNHKSTGRPPSDDKYTSKYLDVSHTPLYPFGHGLSYTTFTLSDLTLNQQEMRAGETLKVSVKLANSGRRQGDEVVQLYVQDVASSVTRPVKELKGFKRVSLAPAESTVVDFKLGPEELGFYDQRMQWKVEPGRFKIWVGTSSVGGLETEFTVR